jgi:hypothetical protein
VEVFENVSKIASTICVKEISPYDVAMILTVMKLVRMRESRTETDHYIDGVNYLAMAGEFANLQSSKDIAFGDDLRELITRKDDPAPEQEQTVEEMASKLAPEYPPGSIIEVPVEPSIVSTVIDSFSRKKAPLKTADLPADFMPGTATDKS